MLVLTRKTNQSIMIGDEIEVSILSVAGDKVRIGIDAPRDIAVFRKEVYIAIDEGSSPSGSSAPRPKKSRSTANSARSISLKPSARRALTRSGPLDQGRVGRCGRAAVRPG